MLENVGRIKTHTSLQGSRVSLLDQLQTARSFGLSPNYSNNRPPFRELPPTRSGQTRRALPLLSSSLSYHSSQTRAIYHSDVWLPWQPSRPIGRGTLALIPAHRERSDDLVEELFNISFIVSSNLL